MSGGALHSKQPNESRMFLFKMWASCWENNNLTNQTCATLCWHNNWTHIGQTIFNKQPESRMAHVFLDSLMFYM